MLLFVDSSDLGIDHITDVEEMPSVSVEVAATEGGTASVLQEPTCDDMTALLEAIADSGYHFTHWSDGDTNAQRTLTVGTTDIMITAHFEADVPPVGIQGCETDSVTVRVNGRRIIVDGTTLPVTIYDIMGRTINPNKPLHAGVYIVRIGMTTTRKVLIY